MKEAVYVLGSGSLALSCAEYIKNQGVSVSLYDTTENPSGLLKRQAELKGIPYKKESREDVFQMFLGLETDLLLVSAINEWLIPGRVLERPNITAVNLHQALLPKHPGRNAEAWAIFEQDKTSGITWHLMEEKVDGGDILLQKEIPLDEKTTSIALFRRQIACAYEGFQEIFLSLMEGTLPGDASVSCKSHRVPLETRYSRGRMAGYRMAGREDQRIFKGNGLWGTADMGAAQDSSGTGMLYVEKI